MNQEQWTAMDEYFNTLFIPSDPILEATQHAANAAGLPAMNVAPNQGKLLMILAQSMGAQRILEIGTLAGYSTLWLARGLRPGGSLITLEIDPVYAEIARANFAQAGLAEVIEIRVGNALETLPQLASEQREPFDLVFIDADKVNSVPYFNWALKLTRRGGLIIMDNVVRNGAIIDPGNSDPSTQGVREWSQMIATQANVTATAIQTVGSKGYDGLAIVLVTDH